MDDPSREVQVVRSVAFVTTRWTVVMQAGGESAEAEAALARLCRDYWYPLYAYARRRGMTVPDAQDVTQGFFLHLLEAGTLQRASPDRGRFRTFLLSSMQHFLANEYRRQQTAKRGGGRVFIELDALDAESRFVLEPVNSFSAETQFERSWAFSLIERVFQRLAEDYSRAGRSDLFQKLRPFLAPESSRPGHATAAQELGMSASAVGVAIHRMRRRYGELMREEIAHTVASPNDVPGEIAHLMTVVSGG